MGALWGRGGWGCSSAVSSLKEDCSEGGLAGRLLLLVAVSPMGQRCRVFVQRCEIWKYELQLRAGILNVSSELETGILVTACSQCSGLRSFKLLGV